MRFATALSRDLDADSNRLSAHPESLCCLNDRDLAMLLFSALV
jgi:hypothetical protein